jgi:hypothetical protein
VREKKGVERGAVYKVVQNTIDPLTPIWIQIGSKSFHAVDRFWDYFMD